jgi:NADH-quinone oxidoreductase subunit J
MLTLLFYIFAIVCVGSALFVAFTPNVVHAALALVPTFGSLAGLYLLLGADFIAITQVAIYIGAILVLMLFGIMYTHNIARISGEQVTMQIGQGLIVALVTLFTLVATVVSTQWPVKEISDPTPTLNRIGVLFLTDYLIPFEVASVLLLVALIGAVVIAHSSQGTKTEDRS